MVAVSRFALAAVLAVAATASPIVDVQQRDNAFEDISGLLANLGQGLGATLNDLLHLNPSATAQDISNLLGQVSGTLNDLTNGFSKVQSGSITQNAATNQYVGLNANGIVSGLLGGVDSLLSGLLNSPLVGDVTGALRGLVNDLNNLLTGIPPNLSNSQEIKSSINATTAKINQVISQHQGN